MRPCVGINGICPPLCRYSDLLDGTYSIADVERFNVTMDEIIKANENEQ